MPEPIDTPVLIVGGGPVGLSLALDLAWRGNRSTLIEREPGTGVELLAKANGLHERTMETCRRWGLVHKVMEVGFPRDHAGDSVYCTSLMGHFIGRSVIPSANLRPTPPESPEKRQRCPQYEFDPLLARAVQERALTDLRYGVAFRDLEQDDHGVTAIAREVATGREYPLRAGYLIACDGAGSRVRRSIDVPFDGRMLDFSLSAMIRIRDLAEHHPIRDGERYILIGPDGAGKTSTFQILGAIFLVMTMGWLFVSERRQGTLKRLQAAPVTRGQILARVYVPSMMPVLLETLRISMIFNFTGVMIAEMYASRTGIGHLISNWGENFQLPQLFAGVILLAVVAIAFNEAVRFLEHRYSAWRT